MKKERGRGGQAPTAFRLSADSSNIKKRYPSTNVQNLWILWYWKPCVLLFAAQGFYFPLYSLYH